MNVEQIEVLVNQIGLDISLMQETIKVLNERQGNMTNQLMLLAGRVERLEE